jgi:hypothetical protein
MCYIDGQNNKYSVLNECNRMLKYNIFKGLLGPQGSRILFITIYEGRIYGGGIPTASTREFIIFAS